MSRKEYGSQNKDVKSVKSAHLLHDFMRSVATIAAFEGPEKKDKERNRIEREFRRCDEHLSGLIEQKRDELTSSAHTFSQVVTRLSSIKETSDSVRSCLLSAKDHLRGKQEDLKALWLQSVELQEELKLLSAIDRVKDLPVEVRDHVVHCRYLQAVQDIVQGLQVVNGKLREVEAVSNVRGELQQARDDVTELMLRQLEQFLYVRTTSSVLRKFSVKREQQNENDLDGPEIPVATVVHCLHDMDRLADALKSNYHALNDKLQQVFLRTTEMIHAIHYVQILQNKERPELLEQLIRLLTEQYTAIAEAHKAFLNEVHNVRFSADMDPILRKALDVYDMTDVWLAVESIMQRILAHYLDQKNEDTKEAVDKRELQYVERIKAAWSRKRPKKITGIEFKFDNSTSTQVLNDYVAEERRRKLLDGGAALLSDTDDMELKKICSPSVKNITMVYPSIMKLCDKIDSSSSVNGKACVLSMYINRFVADVYLPLIEQNILDKLKAASKDDTMKLAPPSALKNLKENQIKVLLNFYQVERQIEDLCDLLYAMPLHSQKILVITGESINEFLIGLQTTFQRITAFLPGKEIPESVRWTDDEQFCLFYRALPGWYYRKPSEPMIVQSSTNEYETLMKMYDASSSEIMNDAKVMRTIVLMMENCQWLSHMLEKTTRNLPVTDAAPNITTKNDFVRPFTLIGTTNELSPIPTRYVDPLRLAAAALMDFAEKCFLAVHWEIRIRCLYYIYKTFVTTRLDLTLQDACEDTERRVGLLVADLWSIARTISHVVQESKFAFFFRSVGNLLRDIIIRSADQMVKINSKAIKCIKRCVFHLEEALTQITGVRDPVFEEVRQYFDMFLTAAKPGDIVSHMMEQRRSFSDREYEMAIRLLHRTYQHDMRLTNVTVIPDKNDHTVLSWTADEEVEQCRRILDSLTVK